MTAENLDSVGEKSQEVFVPHRLVVEFSDNVVVKLVGNSTVRKHGPVNRPKLFPEFGREALILVNLRCRQNGVDNSGWWAHG